MLVDPLRQCSIGQFVVIAVDHLVFHPRPRAHRRALRRLDHSIPQLGQNVGVGVPHVVKDLGEFGHYIGRGPAAGDHVVNARILRHVLAHQVDHVIHRLDRVQSRAPALGCHRRVGGDAAEAKLRRLVGQRGARAGGVAIRRVPVEYRIDVVEQPGAHHVNLARATLLGRRTVEPNSPSNPLALQPLRGYDHRRQRPGAEEMVPAGVARTLGHARRAICHRLLRQPRQGVEFRQQRYHRLALTVLGDKGRGNTGDPTLEAETRRRQVLLQQRRAALFEIAQFGVFPDRLGHGGEFARPRIDSGDHVLFPMGHSRAEQQGQKSDHRFLSKVKGRPFGPSLIPLSQKLVEPPGDPLGITLLQTHRPEDHHALVHIGRVSGDPR